MAFGVEGTDGFGAACTNKYKYVPQFIHYWTLVVIVSGKHFMGTLRDLVPLSWTTLI